MRKKILAKRVPATLLSALLVLSLAGMTGCGILAPSAASPEQSKPEAPSEPPNLARTRDNANSYKNIEIFYATKDAPKYSPDNKAYLYENNGWLHVHVEGSPKELGYQHGWLLASDIQNAIDFNVSKLGFSQGLEWSYLKENAMKMWSDKIQPEYVLELEGIVAGAAERGATFDYGDLLTLNGLEELLGYWQTTHFSSYISLTSRINGGNAFIATGSHTTDGTIVLAHNTVADFDASGFLNVIFDVVPETGEPFIMESQAGFIYSLADVYSSKSLLVTAVTIANFKSYVVGGTPLLARARQAVQHSTSLDGFASAISDGNNGGCAKTWLVGELSSNEIMQLELGHSYSNVQKATDGTFVATGAVQDAQIQNLETVDVGNADIRLHQSSAQLRLNQLLQQFKSVKLDSENAKMIISDHFDAYLSKTGPGSRTVCEHDELDKMEYSAGLANLLPYQPRGTVDGVVLTSGLAQTHSIIARLGSSCGKPFDSAAFFKSHPQFDGLKDYVFDRPAQPWTKIGQQN